MIALLAAVALIQGGHQSTAAQLMDAGHFKRARPLVEAALRANPNDAAALNLASQLAALQNNLDSARALAERAVKADPASADHHYQLGSVAGRQAQRASIFKQPGLAGKFKGEMNEALKRDSLHVDARYSLIQFYLEAPGIVGGDKKKARAMAEDLVRTNPSRGYRALLDVTIAEKDTTHRAELLGKAVAADSNDYAARMDWAGFVLGRDSSRSPAAERESRNIVAHFPDRSGGYLLLAIVLATQQRWSDLDSLLALAEHRLPDNLSPYYHAGRILQTKADSLERAERYLRHYLSQEPEGGAPGLGAAHWRLGLVLEKRGQKAEAIREIEQALKLQPQLEPAKKDLKRLKG